MILPGRRRLLVYIDLIQDIDVLLPVLVAIRRDTAWPVSIRVARWLEAASPRTAALLARHRLPFRYVRRTRVVEGREPGLGGVAALLTASESTAEAHAAGHALAQRARTRGVATFTLQHGLEQPGLTDDSAGFASGTVLTWFADPGALAARPDTAARLVPVGRPASPPVEAGRDIGLAVFENLHWDRYAEADRARFLSDLLATARARPDLSILVRAHPAGGWLDQHAGSADAPPNLRWMSASQARASPLTARDLIARAERVATTPSTIVLDAAEAGRPVALAVPGGDLYRPVRVLAGVEDWLDFCDRPDAAPGARFASRVIVAGDASPRIVQHLAGAMRP